MVERYVQEFDGERKPENNEIQWGNIQIERDREMTQFIDEFLRVTDRNLKLCADIYKANIISEVQAKYQENAIKGRNSFYRIEAIQNELDNLSIEDRDPNSEESNSITQLTKELEKERRKFQHSKPKLCFYLDRRELLETLKNNKIIEAEENNQSLS